MLKEPEYNCNRCSRLELFRTHNRRLFADWFNGPVPSFGALNAKLLIVGLAPGLRGANQTGRPFTGDFAGDLLYSMLHKYGFSIGNYGAHSEDGLALENCRITNSVRCVPPKNKPIASEIVACRGFLQSEIKSMKYLSVILALGRVAHESIISALELKRVNWPFGHGNQHFLSKDFTLIDSYHCSRYNTNTGRLTIKMFDEIFALVQHKI